MSWTEKGPLNKRDLWVYALWVGTIVVLPVFAYHLGLAREVCK